MVTGDPRPGNGDDRAALGRILPDHDVEAEVGRGQHGVVWRARHRQLRRPVAVKRLAVVSDEHATRFRREARVLASIDHPHVVTVYDYREVGDDRVIVMELLAGGTLADRFADGMSPESTVAAVLSAAAGLAQVHAQGILHRDVKPENLMFDDRGRLEVTDFGLAREDQLDTTAIGLTHAGHFFGTPAYAAPEQIGAAMASGWPPVSAASDEYSLAAVLYEGLSGRRTHDESGGAVAFCNRRMQEEARLLGEVAADVPVPIASVVSRALRRDPTERYPDCETFGVALAEAAGRAWGPGWLQRSEVPLLAPGPILAAAGGPASAAASSGATSRRPAEPTGSEEARGLRRRWPVLVGAAVVLALVGVAAAAVLGREGGSGGSATPTPTGPGSAVLDPIEVWSFRTKAAVASDPVLADHVGGARIVVGGRDGIVYALDPDSGDEIWRQEVGPMWTSPAVDDDTVYVGGDDGMLRALALDDGEVRWSKDTGTRLRSSPAVADGTVVVGAMRLLAFDAESGTPLWDVDAGLGVVSSPAIADGTVYVGTNSGDVLAVGLDDGKERWRKPVGAPVQSSPHVEGDRVLVGGDDGVLRAMDGATGRTLWDEDIGSRIYSSPTVVGSTVVVGTDAGDLTARDVATGQEVWTTLLPGGLESSPLVLDGRVVVGCLDGRVHIVDLSSGDWLGSFTTGDAVVSSPTAVGHRFVVGSNDDQVYLVGGLGGS